MMELLRDLWMLARYPPVQAMIGWSAFGWALVYAKSGMSWVALAYGVPAGVLIGLSLRKVSAVPSEKE